MGEEKKSRIPDFETVEEEAEFWDTHSFEEFEDELEEVTDVRFVVRRQTEGVTVRFDPQTLARLKKIAQAKGVGPSTLLRMWALERMQEESKKAS